MPDIRVGHQMFEKFEGGCINPLQVVKEESERVLLASDDPQESPKQRLEPGLRFQRGKLWDGRLLTQHELQLGYELYEKLTVQTHSVPNRVPPTSDLKLALAQSLADQSPKGLGERSVRDVALVLVELTRNEDATRQDNCFVKLVYDRGLANTGVAGHKHELGPAVRHDPIKGFEQRLDLRITAVELFADQQPVRRVVFAERKRGNLSEGLPGVQASPEICLQAGRSLISLLGDLGK